MERNQPAHYVLSTQKASLLSEDLEEMGMSENVPKKNEHKCIYDDWWKQCNCILKSSNTYLHLTKQLECLHILKDHVHFNFAILFLCQELVFVSKKNLTEVYYIKTYEYSCWFLKFSTLINMPIF